MKEHVKVYGINGREAVLEIEGPVTPACAVAINQWLRGAGKIEAVLNVEYVAPEVLEEFERVRVALMEKV